jgi:peptidoglycan/xylan/chitin deacetylase (PgdA/CDA1 family)
MPATLPNLLKSAAKTAFHRGGGVRLARWIHRRGLRILMYHRFRDPAALARQCAYLRKHYQPVSMSAVADWLDAGRPLPPNAVAVTVDDGYRDFAPAYPIFAEYGIPVTVFLITDFLDGKLWLWFDRVQQAFLHAGVPEATINMPDGSALRFDLGSPAARRVAGQRMADLAVALSESDRCRLVADLPFLLRAGMPDQLPPDCLPLTWDSVRALAARGVEFGAHTKSHPILSAVADAATLHDEVAGSKARIEAELGRSVLHFCYPNGKLRDIGPAAIEAVRAAGMRTAVTAEPGLNRAGADALLLRRMAADPAHEELYFRQGMAGLRS